MRNGETCRSGEIWRGELLGAGAQDIISGIFIEDGLTVVDNLNSYNFEQVKIFWVLAALVLPNIVLYPNPSDGQFLIDLI
ncbi:MAG: hypothetical protein ACJA08_003227, partial [Cyclobacteriaceae bacterium]